MTLPARQLLRRQRWLKINLWAFSLFMVIFPLAAILGAANNTPLAQWTIIVPILWGLGLMAHWLVVSGATDDAPLVEDAWERVYAAGSRPALPDDQWETLRQQVDADLPREKRRRRNHYHRLALSAYILSALVGWLIIPVLFGSFEQTNLALWLSLLALTAGGGIGLSLHSQSVKLDTPEGTRRLQLSLLAQRLAEQESVEKPKRNLRLEADGEISLDDLTDAGVVTRETIEANRVTRA